MDIYIGSFDLKPGIADVEFAEDLQRYMDYLQHQKLIHSYRLIRRKLGLGQPELGEFLVLIEVENLGQLDAAFQTVASRSGDAETHHFSVNSTVQSSRFSLYRDFPDPVRVRGQERF